MHRSRERATDVIVRHLATNPSFAGIGFAKAAKLGEAFGSDLARVLADGDVQQFVPIVGREVAEGLIVAWREHLARGDTVVWLGEHGLDPRFAGKIVDFWGEEAPQRLNENPYILLAFTGFAKVDAAARSLGIAASDPRRLIAGAEAALYAGLDDRHTWMSNDDLVAGIRRLLACDAQAAANAIALAIEDNAIEACGEGWQAAGPAMMEQFVARRLEQMVKPPMMEDLIAREVGADEVTAALEDWCRREDLVLDDEQRQAVEIGVRERFGIMTGGAGVGKTTVLKALVALCEQFGRSVHMAALAGRAAVRMSQATGRPASTIAAFLKAVAAHKIALGPESLVVFDESSMLDLPTFYKILRVLPDGCRLMLVGDPGQLPPIGFGLTFHVLAEAGIFPMVELQKVYRQTGVSGIPAVSRSIRNGIVPDLGRFEGKTAGVSFVPCGAEAMADAIVDVAAELGNIGDEVRMLSAVKAGPAGILALNQRFHRIMAAGRGVWMGYAVGEPVMFLKNDYQRGLRNGSLGKVLAHDEGLVCDFDGQEHRFSQQDLSDLMLAYAMTVHKSQGSQFKRVIVPVQRSRILDRTLIYTAVTRATDQVVLIGDTKGLRMAITDPPSASRRKTGMLAQFSRFERS
ncbi:AAA family ATPase [Devosia sediminis]|uniref:AAA family ATPase n=1 Tax=Devosia sediminis TaxID=2798801 RepID=A0A934IS52_9HYPH|nr:AAA family ATPase [Devosia sediminis]MBJ3784191.1 AAA family ATPase [Devosia sediminis]